MTSDDVRRIEQRADPAGDLPAVRADRPAVGALCLAADAGARYGALWCVAASGRNVRI
jgi:hypothetical protein